MTLLKSMSGLLSLAALAALSVSAQAVPLLPGTVVVTPGTAVAPTDTGTTLATSTSNFTANTGTFSGSLTTSVIREASGFLTFTFQVTNNAGSPDGIERFSNIDFQNFTTDVDFVNTGTGTVGPATADRSFLPVSTIGFDFGRPAGLPAGTTSKLVIIRTNATTFTSGVTNFIDGGIASVASFAPALGTAAVPEPSTYATFGLAGLGLLGLMIRARKTRRVSGPAA